MQVSQAQDLSGLGATKALQCLYDLEASGPYFSIYAMFVQIRICSIVQLCKGLCGAGSFSSKPIRGFRVYIHRVPVHSNLKQFVSVYGD